MKPICELCKINTRNTAIAYCPSCLEKWKHFVAKLPLEDLTKYPVNTLKEMFKKEVIQGTINVWANK